MEPEQNLQEDEELVKSAHPSMWSYFPVYLIGLFITFATLNLSIIASGLAILAVSELHRRGNRYFITTDRVIREFRFLKRDSQEATTDLISDVSIDQSLNQRLLKIGDVHVKTASGENIRFGGVKKPGEIKSKISKVKTREKNEPQEVEVVNDKVECPNCGDKVSSDSDYCSSCGARLETGEKVDLDTLLDQTIAEIKDDVKARDLEVESIIEAEKDGKKRKTLIEWLENRKDEEE